MSLVVIIVTTCLVSFITGWVTGWLTRWNGCHEYPCNPVAR